MSFCFCSRLALCFLITCRMVCTSDRLSQFLTTTDRMCVCAFLPSERENLFNCVNEFVSSWVFLELVTWLDVARIYGACQFPTLALS